jgi:hypothetical protein
VKLRYLAVLAATGIVLLCAGTAMARKSFSTTITHDGSNPVGTEGVYIESGQVNSSRLPCRALRLVKLIGHYPSGRTELLDVDLTSLNGAWATKADLTDTDQLKARVAKFKYGRRGHRKVCQADSVVYASPIPTP